jgi:hypothetical protein
MRLKTGGKSQAALSARKGTIEGSLPPAAGLLARPE